MSECPALIVTGGAGFIGSALVRSLLSDSDYRVINLDKLTYAGNLESLGALRNHPRHVHIPGDISDGPLVRALLERHCPIGIIHLAAESHVDRSIDGPADFVQTNVVGTFTLLHEARRYWEACRATGRAFRFLHVSTDEVFGSLTLEGQPFSQSTPYNPSSPYSATKAASDHLVRSWGRTYGLPVVITNCSNNYGPYQFPEKLVPLMILMALEEHPLPVYGTGMNVRDWIFVEDHVSALRLVFTRGTLGETYLVGGDAERTNLQVVEAICDILDQRLGRSGAASCRQLITFVRDRPGHDWRYAIDSNRIKRDLGWAPRESFESGLSRTVDWYLNNAAWWRRVRSGDYRQERLGLGGTA